MCLSATGQYPLFNKAAGSTKSVLEATRRNTRTGKRGINAMV